MPEMCKTRQLVLGNIHERISRAVQIESGSLFHVIPVSAYIAYGVCQPVIVCVWRCVYIIGAGWVCADTRSGCVASFI